MFEYAIDMLRREVVGELDNVEHNPISDVAFVASAISPTLLEATAGRKGTQEHVETLGRSQN